jgi:aerobic C4-dicarboxylate transport protein
MNDLKKVGTVGLKAFIYFEVVTTFALAIGLIVVNVTKPGAGIDVSTMARGDVSQYAAQGKSMSFSDFLTHIVPTSVVDAFAKGDILQVLLFSVLFGFALHALGAPARPVLDFINQLSSVLFRIVAFIMKTAPLGAFGAMAFTIGNFGVGTLAQLGKLIACFYVTCVLFVALVLSAIARVHGFSVWQLVKYIKEELFIVYGTSSSESALPRIMAKLEALGVARSVVGLVIPASYSFNLDGSAIYLTIAAVFIAQATNTPFGLMQQLTLLAILMLTSKGTAGVAGAALIVLAGTISATGVIPVAGVALVLGIHRFMGEAMAVTNLIGNGVATIVVGKWCGQVDERVLAKELAGERTTGVSERKTVADVV